MQGEITEVNLHQLCLLLLLVMISSLLQVQLQEHFGHWVKTLVLGLVFYFYDFATDVVLGIYYYHPKNVTRYLGNSTMIPVHCVPHQDVDRTGKFDCEEEDKLLACGTFLCILAPQLTLIFEHGREMLFYIWSHGFDTHAKKALLRFFYFVLVPFPIIIFCHHVSSLFIMSELTETQSISLLAAEASFEAGSQLILQICIILSAQLQKVIRIAHLENF